MMFNFFTIFNLKITVHCTAASDRFCNQELEYKFVSTQGPGSQKFRPPAVSAGGPSSIYLPKADELQKIPFWLKYSRNFSDSTSELLNGLSICFFR